MIAVPHPVNMFSDKEKSLILDGESSAKDREEHPCALTLGELMLWWNKVHSVILTMSRTTDWSQSVPRRESRSKLILKRNMVPIAPKTVSLGNINNSEVDMSTAKKGTFVVMDYPVFLSGRSDKAETYEAIHYSSSGELIRNSSKYDEDTAHTFGSAMINFGKTKLDVSSGKPLFLPQIGVIVKGHARSFTGEGVDSIGNLGYVNGISPSVPPNPIQSLQIFGTNPYTDFNSINFNYDLAKQNSYDVEGAFEIGGYFSEFKVLSLEPTEAGFSIHVSFPKKTDFIDYLDYLEEVWAGPNKGKKGSVSSSGGTILFSKPTAPWSGPVMFAKKNRADWFLSDNHITITAP